MRTAERFYDYGETLSLMTTPTENPTCKHCGESKSEHYGHPSLGLGFIVCPFATFEAETETNLSGGLVAECASANSGDGCEITASPAQNLTPEHEEEKFFMGWAIRIAQTSTFKQGAEHLREFLREALAARESAPEAESFVTDRQAAAYSPLGPYLDQLERDNAELRRKLEREQMCHAACGVIATSNTPESLAHNRQMHTDYLSASVQECIRAAEREIELRRKLEEIESQNDGLVAQVRKHSAYAQEREAYARKLLEQQLRAWVPVAERKPTEVDADEYGYIEWCDMLPDGRNLRRGFSFWGNLGTVTHWRTPTPLPANRKPRL